MKDIEHIGDREAYARWSATPRTATAGYDHLAVREMHAESNEMRLTLMRACHPLAGRSMGADLRQGWRGLRGSRAADLFEKMTLSSGHPVRAIPSLSLKLGKAAT